MTAKTTPPSQRGSLAQGKKDGKWRYTVRGANGEKIATSEPYASKSNAKRALLTNHPEAELS